jgi:hypothetical protein
MPDTTTTLRTEIETMARRLIAAGFPPEVVAGELVAAGACLVAAKHGAAPAGAWLRDAAEKVALAETTH